MNDRRSFLVGAMSIGLSGFATACARPRKVQKTVTLGVEFKELLHKDPDEFVPLIVPIHGNGGAPEHWISGWITFPGRANIALPRGFNKQGQDGFSWFPFNANMNDEKLAADVDAAEEKLWKAIVSLARGRRVIVAGFAEGAMLSTLIALRHPDAVVHAFPMAGACVPTSLIPKEKTKVAAITAYHGASDEVIPIQTVRDTVAAIKKINGDVELREYAAVKHSATDKMHDDLHADMQKAALVTTTGGR